MNKFIALIVLCFVSLSLNKEVNAGQSEDPATITLMVVYTPDAKEYADEFGGGIDNIIAQGMAYTQLTLDNSEINVEIELVHTSEIDYEETGDSELDLTRLSNSNNGFMDEAHNWRDEHDADLVKLLTRHGDVGGVAFLPRSPNSNTAFSLTRIQAASGSTFAHEIGHNLGFHHSRNQNLFPAGSMGGIFEYSTGWRWSGDDGNDYVSVMTYESGSDGHASRVPYFSNPEMQYQGGATGSYTGQYAPADNARSLYETKHYFANYRGGQAESADSLVVVELYNSTSGNNWSDNSGWLNPGTQLKNWQGVKAYGKVTEIKLSINNLIGELPVSIFDLDGLWELELRHNQLTGSLHAEIGNLKFLRTLDVASNQLEGSLPESITSLDKLDLLDLSRNQFQGELPNEIVNLTLLRYFVLDRNEFTGTLPDDIGNLNKLLLFNVSDNLLDGEIPVSMGGLRELLILNLSSNQFSGELPSELGSLEKLFALYLSNNQFRGPIPESFLNLSNLRTFLFDDTNLCVPSGADFQNWLNGVSDVTESYVICEDAMPEIAELIYPADNQQNVSPQVVQLEWSSQELDVTYNLKVSEHSDFSVPVIDEDGLGETSYQLNDIEQGVTFYWRVQAVGKYLDGEWSETSSFTTAESDAPGQIVLAEPEDGAEEMDVNPEFSWYPDDNSEFYLFQLSDHSGFDELIAEFAEYPDTILALPDTLDYHREYFWRVAGQNEFVTAEWSEIWTFRTEVELPGIVNLSAPENGADDISITPEFSWQEADRAEAYRIMISEESSFESSEVLVDSSGVEETVFQLEDELEPVTEYFWRVAAVNNSGEGDWSETWSFATEMTTSVELAELPSEFTLSQNYPNPFNPTTVIRYGVPESSQVRLEVFNMLGQRVSVLVNEQKTAGWHNFTFDASNLSSGMYIYRMQAGEFVETRKLILIK